jgi:dTMP kinase
MPGFFIVLDGPDGSGTTTQAEFLAERLRAEGKDVLLTAEPSSGEIGKGIRHWLKNNTLPADALQLLFTADRADHIAKVIAPALAAGRIVVCDRYVPSTLIYGELQGLPAEWLAAISGSFPKPDMVFFTLPPLDVCLRRLQKREQKDMFETEAMQTKLHELYRNYAEREKETIVIDTSADKETTATIVHDAVKAKLP